MDPNNGQSESGTDVMAKLEEDLQKLTNETDTGATTSQPIGSQLASEVMVPSQEPPQEPPQATESIVETTMPPEVAPNPTIPPEPKKGSPMLIISLGLVVVALLVAIAYVVGMKFFSGASKQIACTAEAKVCEDGTSVGRSGPNCEFDACPVVSATPETTPDPTADWKTYTNTEIGFSFKFPSEWKMQTGIANSGLISLETSSNNRFFAWYSPSVTISEWLEETQSGKIIGKKTIGAYTFTVVQGGSMLESLEYIIDVKGNGIIRFVIEPNSNNSESEKLFDQILSTFNFIEVTPSAILNTNI